MGLNSESRAALVFLILYVFLFVALLYGYIGRYLKWRSRYTIILFHVTIRLSSQASGLAFGIVGYSNINLLVAYFILGAEGYFTLVLCTYRFLIDWHYHNFDCQDSWLERRHPPGTPWTVRFRSSMSVFNVTKYPMSTIHYLLAAANGLIVAGGSILARSKNETDPAARDSEIHQAKIYRIVGQTMFLAINVFLLYCVFATIQRSKREQAQRSTKRPTVHPTLWLLLVVWPLLIVRGLYGILSGVLPEFSFFNFDNYGEFGLKEGFVVSEYLLSTTMEWTSCTILMITYFTSLNDPPLRPLEKWNKETSTSSSTA